LPGSWLRPHSLEPHWIATNRAHSPNGMDGKQETAAEAAVSCTHRWDQCANSELPCLPARRCGEIRKRASAGSSHRAPNMLTMNVKVSISPMSAWNLMAENIQVATPTARHRPVNSTALPVDFSVS